MIIAEGLVKTFQVAKRTAGLRAAVKAMFRREYSALRALQEVSFHIRAGEIVGYIGPNGAGKSTTIKILSGILRPDRGSCLIRGRIPWEERIAHVREIGVVFGQRSQLWWDVPVLDSFELLRDIYQIPSGEYRRTLEMLTETLALGGFLRQPVRQLSLGQKMRCEIAASLLHSPQMLFLDEPTIGLDAVAKQAVRAFIKKINKEQGVTVLLTTHDLADVEALAGRIMLLGKGRLLYDGNLAQLRHRYGDRKTLTVRYRQSEQEKDNFAAGLAPLAAGIQLQQHLPGQALLRVDSRQIPVSQVIASLAAQLEIVDLTVENQPVEDLVLQLYREHNL